MAGIDRLAEVELLLDLYKRSGLEPEEFANEFYEAVKLVVKNGMPIRELQLCVRVPFQKPPALASSN